MARRPTTKRKARRAHCNWHGVASRGDPRLDEHTDSTSPNFWERPTLQPGVATVPGSHRSSVTQQSSMEKRRHGVHVARRLGGAPTGLKSRNRATQEKVEETKVLTAGRRCRRRQLDAEDSNDREGVRGVEVTACFYSPATRPGTAPFNGSRRVIDDAPLSPASFSPLALPHSFPLSSSCGGGQGRGKTLTRLGLREGLGPRVVGAVKAAQGQGHDVRLGWLARWMPRRGGAAVAGDVALGVAGEG
jgi:hypothetical protein